MDWLARHLAVFPAPELVLVVGAGQGRDLPVLKRFSQARLLLLEPQPRWADFLRRQIVGLPRAEVLEYALDDESGSGTLAVFNFPELSSLRPDPALPSLLPGARQTAQLPVETRSLADLVQQLDVPTSPNHWLIVDAPDIESAVLTSLADPDMRRRFGHVVLRSKRRVVDGEDADVEPLADLLLARGYRVLGEEDRSDGDWPRLHLQHFRRSPQRRELEGRLDALRQRSQELAAEKSALQEQLEQQRVQLEDRMSKFDEELQSVNRDAEQRLAALAADLEKSRQELRRHQDNETRTAELEERLARANSTLEERQADLDRRDAMVREREESHQARVAELMEQIESLRRERDQQIAKLEGVIEQTKSDLSVSLRLQTLRENDLKELQERYAGVLETRNAQHELLLKIRKRLSLAAEYLLQLKNESDEQRKNELTSGLVEALAHGVVDDAD